MTAGYGPGGAILQCSTEGAMSVLTAYSSDTSSSIYRQNICYGPDGNFWMTSGTDGYLAQVSSTGDVLATFGGPNFFGWNRTPFAICVGWDDNLWVLTYTTTGGPTAFMNVVQTDGTLLHANIADFGDTHEVATYTGPFTMCLGPDGALWLLTATTEQFATKFPSGSYIGTSYPSSGTGTGNARGICAGGDGNLWTAGWNQTTDTGGIYKVTTSGVWSVEYQISGTGTQRYVLALCLGSDGNIWFTACDFQPSGGFSSTATMNRITPSGTVTTWPLFSSSTLSRATSQCALVSGPDGNLWTMIETGSLPGPNTCTLLRFDISTQAVTQFRLPPESATFSAEFNGPYSYAGITVGSDMYFTAVYYPGPTAIPPLRMFQRSDAFGVRQNQTGSAVNAPPSVRNQSAGNAYT